MEEQIQGGEGQPQEGGGQGGAELVQGVFQAAGMIMESVAQAPGVPDEAKHALAQATQQYLGVLEQVISGGQAQAQPQQVDSVPGGRPLTPAGV